MCGVCGSNIKKHVVRTVRLCRMCNPNIEEKASCKAVRLLIRLKSLKEGTPEGLKNS